MYRLCILAVALVAGCAPRGVPVEKLPEIKTVGVVSALGDQFALQTQGITVFGNDLTTMPIDGWNIDAYVVDRISAQLAGRYDLRPVTYRKQDFNSRRFYVTDGEKQVVGEKRPSLGEFVRDNVVPQGLDAYVIVLRGSSVVGMSNQVIGGLGMLKASGIVTEYDLFALYSIAIIDGHRWELLGVRRAAAPDEGLFPVIRGPNRWVSERLWSDTPAALSGAQRQEIETTIKTLIEQSLPNTLRQLKLVNGS